MILPSSARQPARPTWSRERLLHERAIALGFALEPSSFSSYSSAFHSYISFCNKHNLCIEPTPDTLSLYVVYTSHFIRPRSVKSYLSGICNKLESFYPSVRDCRRHKLVTRTLAGCLKSRTSPIIRKRPLTREEVGIAATSLSSSQSHDDKLFCAILTTSFHHDGLLRLGESVFPDNPALRDFRKCALRSTVTTNKSSYSFLLPSHKDDRFYEGNRVLISSTSTLDNPLAPFTSYLASRDRSFPLQPHLWLRSNGSVPTRRWFMTRLTTLFKDNVGGHSMRAGGATALAVAGIAPHLIQAMGRWSSEAFQIYIRTHPSLLASLVYAPHHCLDFSAPIITFMFSNVVYSDIAQLPPSLLLPTIPFLILILFIFFSLPPYISSKKSHCFSRPRRCKGRAVHLSIPFGSPTKRRCSSASD